MSTLESLKDSLIDDAKDIRLNMSAVLTSGSLEPQHRYAVAYTSALFLQNETLTAAILAEAGDKLTPEVLSDARAAASIMAMNTIYYRFRHMIGKESYQNRPAGLRMARMGKPATSKGLFELCSMACAVLAGCELCVKSHEASLRHEEFTEEQVNDTVRTAAVINGFATALFASKN